MFELKYIKDIFLMMRVFIFDDLVNMGFCNKDGFRKDDIVFLVED